jgi:glycerol-3-phosphate dehydrogenase
MTFFTRQAQLQQVITNAQALWDIIVVGGGATGLGCAIDAANRGYKVLLIEKFDFGKGTSSRSTKLFHGGVRYLAQGNINLVRSALKERYILLQNAPHLSRTQSFLIPTYKWWGKFYYGAGLKLYDYLSGNKSIGSSSLQSKQKMKDKIPNLIDETLKGGVQYFDGQFNDARMCLNLAQTACQQGATIINYLEANQFIFEKEKITGLECTDVLSNTKYSLKAKHIINATGVFADDLIEKATPNHEKLISPSQGVHLVVNKNYLNSQHAIMIPKTKDGRVLFAVPWFGKTILGTTDTPLQNIKAEPKALPQEIEFIIEHIKQTLGHAPGYENIDTVYAGLRPLIKKKDAKGTSALSRDHFLLISASGLITITGGKWTTYRKMAEDTINKIETLGIITKGKNCQTESLKIFGFSTEPNNHPLHYYGAQFIEISQLEKTDEELAKYIHPQLPYTYACVLYALTHEMALTLEDVLARRTNALLHNAKASIEAAPAIASFMQKQFNQTDAWRLQQIESFNAVAKNYLV